jgi:hypothetical protein
MLSILTSPDGMTWTPHSLGRQIILNSVTWAVPSTGSGTGQLVAVGASIQTSPDGEIWTSRTSGTTNFLRSVTWTGTQFVAVGQGGVILTSPQDPVMINPCLHAKNELTLRACSGGLSIGLPSSFAGSDVRAAIYTVAGNKVMEVRTPDLNGEVQVPIDALTRGTYLLEATNSKVRITQLFSLMR